MSARKSSRVSFPESADVLYIVLDILSMHGINSSLVLDMM